MTKRAGLYDPTAKALGVALFDHNGDGWLDLFVANDTQPNRLYENKQNGTFTDIAVAAGVAFNEAGVARAGMGVDAADYDGSGRPGLVIGNFSNEMIALYQNEGKGLFIDEAPASTIGKTSLLTLTFSCFFFDYDLDGKLDIFAANGHVADDISTVQPRVKYAQPPHLFRNTGNRRFEAVTASAGAALQEAMVARGAAYGDYDGDGDPDLLVTTNNGPARLLRNDGGERSHRLRLKFSGTKSNRDAIGTFARVDHGRRPLVLADGQDRFELSFPERAAVDVRTRQRGASHQDRGQVAGRARRDAAGCRGERVARGRGRQGNRVQDTVRYYARACELTVMQHGGIAALTIAAALSLTSLGLGTSGSSQSKPQTRARRPRERLPRQQHRRRAPRTVPTSPPPSPPSAVRSRSIRRWRSRG